MQLPDGVHGSAALVIDVIRGFEEGVRSRTAGVQLIFVYELEHLQEIL